MNRSHNTFMRHITPQRIMVFVLVVLTTVGCMSRLRRNLFVTQAGVTSRTDVTGTQFYRGAMMNPFPETPNDLVVPGDENLLVLFCEHRGKKSDRSLQLTLDEVVRFQLFIPLPVTLRAESIQVTDRMVAQKIGDYSKKIEDLRFLGTAGTFIIDSVANELLFAHIDANFSSALVDSVRFSGEFKAKVER